MRRGAITGTQGARNEMKWNEMKWNEMSVIYFHLVFWRIWRVSKTMPKKWNKIKHMGSAFVVCFLSLWDPMFWLCFCMLCVCLCVCLCACCETLRTCTVVCMSFLCYVFFGVWRCFFEGWANNKLNISQTESIQQEVEILLLSLF